MTSERCVRDVPLGATFRLRSCSQEHFFICRCRWQKLGDDEYRPVTDYGVGRIAVGECLSDLHAQGSRRVKIDARWPVEDVDVDYLLIALMAMTSAHSKA